MIHYKFINLFDDVTKYYTKVPKERYEEKGDVPIIDQGQTFISGYCNNIKPGDNPRIVFGDHTRVFKYIDFPFVIGADGIKVLKLKDAAINYKYIYYYLKKAYIPDTGYNRHFKWVKNLEFNIPEIDIQNKIVSKLDGAQEIIEITQKQLGLLDELIKSRFIIMFKNSEYCKRSIKEISDVVSGGTPSRKNIEYWENGNLNWIKTTELKNNYIYESEEKITNEGLKKSSAKMVPKDTILIAMYGQGKTMGMTALLKSEACTNQACACILPTSIINQKYLWYYMIFSYDELRKLAKGGNQPNLNLEIVRNFKVVTPPIKLQNEFVEFLERVEELKERYKKRLKDAERLKDSLMSMHFGG